MIRWLQGDCRQVLAALPEKSVQCVVTSPPYWGLRKYGDHIPGTIGLEKTLGDWLDNMCEVFRQVRRVLRDDGVVWVNMGDAYVAQAGGVQGRTSQRQGRRHTQQGIGLSDRGTSLARKQLMGQPWRLAMALQEPWLTCKECRIENHASKWGCWPSGRKICPACNKSKGATISQQGWWLRSDCVWHKTNAQPGSWKDRPVTDHEYLFLLTKSPAYYYDNEAIRQPQLAPKRGAVESRGTKDVEAGSNRGFGLAGVTRRAYNPMGRNRRTVWSIPTHAYKGAHFATFPPAIPELCILAGTSQAGCCASCGAPYVRMTEKVEIPGAIQETPSGWDTGAGGHGTVHREGRAVKRLVNPVYYNKTIGWKSQCACENTKAVACTVLDPFGGAGTTAVVADRLSRDAIHIDTIGDYIAQSRARVACEVPLLQFGASRDLPPDEAWVQPVLLDTPESTKPRREYAARPSEHKET